MKKSNGIIFAFILSLCAFLNASAQQANTFNENDLYALRRTAYGKLEGEIYRLTAVDVVYNNGNSAATRTEKTIREVVPPDRYHEITETTTAKGIERREQITVAKRTFLKRNNEEWKEIYSSGGSGYGSGNGSGGGGRIQIENKTERILKKGETVSSQTVDLYETVHIIRYRLRSDVFSVITKSSDWFDKNGLLVKSAYEYENTETKLISRSTKDYEYDPSIKIEAPIKDAPAAAKP